MDQVIEIRGYNLKHGVQAQFHDIMQKQSIPLLCAAGIDVIVASASLHATDAYVLIRAFASLDARAQQQDTFYNSAAWVHGPRDAIMACIKSYTTSVIEMNVAAVDSLRQQGTLA